MTSGVRVAAACLAFAAAACSPQDAETPPAKPVAPPAASVPIAADPSPPPAVAPDGLSVEVVDEDGRPLAGARVRARLVDLGQLSMWDRARFTGEPLADAGDGRALFRTPDGLALSLRLEFFVAVPDRPPPALVEAVVHTGRAETARIVAAKARTADVVVLDAATGLPVAGARVASLVERTRRFDVGMAPSPPAVSDADGRCLLGGLGAGEHRLRIEADGFFPAGARWTGDAVRVRLAPRRGPGRVEVTVLGPRGPVPAARVRLLGSDRWAITDDAGAATFERLAAGHALFVVDADDEAACTGSTHGWPRALDVDVEPGGSRRLSLGGRPAETPVAVGVVDDRGVPIEGPQVELSDDARSATADFRGGDGRFLAAGPFASPCRAKATSWKEHEAPCAWTFDDVEIRDGAATLVLGREVVRGRVVASDGLAFFGGADVTMDGPARSTTPSGEEGRFAFRYARPGVYEIVARSPTGASRTQTIVVPVEGEVVVELETP